MVRHALIPGPDGETLAVPLDATLEVRVYEEGPAPTRYSTLETVAQDVAEDTSRYRASVYIPGEDRVVQDGVEEVERMLQEPIPLPGRNPAPRFRYDITVCTREEDLIPVYREAVRADPDADRYLR